MKKIIILFGMMLCCMSIYAQQRPAVSGNRPPQVISGAYFNSLPAEIQEVIKQNPSRYIVDWEKNTLDPSESTMRTMDSNNTTLPNGSTEVLPVKTRIRRSEIGNLTHQQRVDLDANPHLYEIIE